MQTRKDEDLEMTGIGETRTPIWRNEIIKLKTRALRKGVWYRALTRVERVCIDLVVKVVQRVRSILLKRMLSTVLKKLEEAMESPVHRLMREIGVSVASKLSRIALGWGNKSVERWAKDPGFQQYLAITCMNAPT